MRSKKIFHGPATVGGIGWHLAEGQRERGFKSDCIVYSDNGFRQLYHINLNIRQYGKIGRLREMVFCFFRSARSYEIFHFYSSVTFLPYNLDLPILRLLGKKMVMTYCGSDIRLIKVEKRRNKYFNMLPARLKNPSNDTFKMIRMYWQSLWIQRFTAVRDLHEHAVEVIKEEKVIENLWLNNIGFNSKNTPCLASLFTRKIPQIIHAPSNRAIKGTEYVNRSIQILRDKGLQFHYLELKGVPNHEAQSLIRNCDIVIDQFLLGSIGTLAFEGMGYGKPVIAFLPSAVVHRYLPGCPIYNATVENLTVRLEELIKNHDLRLKLGKDGIVYTKEHLDYESIQTRVIELYEKL